MAVKNHGKNSKITTIKVSLETKERLDHLKEFGKESYDEILRKMLYILNTVRSNPESAQGILHSIDSKLKRKSQIYSSIPKERHEIPAKLPQKINPERQEKRISNPNLRNKFIRKSF